jgi:hypothetical protein
VWNGLKNKIFTQNFSKNLNFCACGEVVRKNYGKNNFFLASLKSMKKGVGSGVGF